MRWLTLLLTFAAVSLLAEKGERPAVKLDAEFVAADKHDIERLARIEERRQRRVWERMPAWKRARIEAAQDGDE